MMPAEFGCTIINEKLMIPNVYNLSISIDPIHPMTENIAMGFQRIKHFFRVCLSDSILINQTHTLVDSLKDFENNIVYLPSEPYDYYVGNVILAKLMAISDGYFDIDFITIDSFVGDRVQYTIYDPYSGGLDIDGNHWWNANSPATGPNDNITWADLNLGHGSKFEPKIIKGGLSEK